MKYKKNLFILSGVWSLGRGQGMSSVHRLLVAADARDECLIITPDKNIKKEDYPNSKLFIIWWPSVNTGSRYIDYILARFFYFFSCFQIFFLCLLNVKHIGLIYANTAIPVVFIFRLLFRLPTVHRAYGTFLRVEDGFFKKALRYEEIFIFWFPASAYIVTNDGTRGDDVARYFGIKERDLFFWRNGVDVKKYNENWRNKLKLTNNLTVFGTICRLVKWKRVDRCIKSFLRSKSPNNRLLVVGDGGELNYLKNLAKEDKRIIFLGKVSSEDASSLMSELDVYLTLYDVSNVGNPLLEALAYGLPIITCSTGDTASVIDGKNGLIFDVVNEQALIDQVSKAIDDISNNVKLRDDLSFFAKKYAENNIVSWNDRILKEIDLLYKLKK